MPFFWDRPLGSPLTGAEAAHLTAGISELQSPNDVHRHHDHALRRTATKFLFMVSLVGIVSLLAGPLIRPPKL